MRFFFIKLLYLTLLICLIIGCQKDVDSLIIGKWLIEEESFQLSIKKDNKYYCSQNYSWQRGVWKLNSNQDSIIFIPKKEQGELYTKSLSQPYSAKILKVDKEYLRIVLRHEELILKNSKVIIEEKKHM